MTRRLVSFTEGSYYHIYNRGASKNEIFFSDTNYDFAMRKISFYSSKTSVRVAACCLMPNHYHLLLHQSGAKAAGYMAQMVFNSYTKAVNRMYNRTGTLFESPFKATLVDKIEYLLQLSRYIHLNPVCAGLCGDVEDWRYSNYLECIGKRKKFPFDPDFIADYLGSPVEYEKFVREYDWIQIKDTESIEI
ncbi:MAG TPA: transposase [Candidatus Kryptonia bacterium]